MIHWGAALLVALSVGIAVYDPVLAGTVQLGVIGVLAVAFVAIYRRRDWRATAAGRGLMHAMSLVAGICLYAFTAFMADAYPAIPLARAALYTAGAVAVWRLLVTMYHSGKDA